MKINLDDLEKDCEWFRRDDGVIPEDAEMDRVDPSAMLALVRLAKAALKRERTVVGGGKEWDDAFDEYQAALEPFKT